MSGGPGTPSGTPEGPVCARCPRALGRSCCEPGPGDRLATLTRADVARIGAHARVAARRFAVEEALTHEEAREYEEARPLWRGYFARAPVRTGLRAVDGACLFHRAGAGCTLPADVRPVACRLYPFERLPGGSWGLTPQRHGSLAAARAEGGGCLAAEEAEDFEAVLAHFGTTLEALEALAAQLAEETRAHGRGG